MDNQETEGSQKTNQRTDGVCDWIFYHSNSKPNLNIPGLTNANGVTGSWISGYKLDPRVGGGGKTRIPLNCVSMQSKYKDHLVFSLPSKAIIMILEEEEEIQVQKMCFNSLNDGAW